VIAGDVNAKRSAPWRSGLWREFRPSRDCRQRHRPQEPEPAAPRTVTLSDPRVEQEGLRRYYLVPSSTTAAAGESPASTCWRS